MLKTGESLDYITIDISTILAFFEETKSKNTTEENKSENKQKISTTSTASHQSNTSEMSQKSEKSEKKISVSKQVAEMHQQSHQVSSTYSEEVLEWQKLARKEKSASSTYQEHHLSTVRIHIKVCFL